MANAFGSTMNQSLENALLIGAGKANSAVDAAQAGLSAVLAGGGQIRSDTNSMRGQAQLVNTQAGSVNMTADELAALATTLAPYADKLGGYGDELSALATSLTEQANDKFGQADALVNMDPNASGLAGEYLKHYASLSPERYVSRAGSDAQASAENALAQNQRALARRGVSVGSGAGLGMRQQYARMLAELTSSAKTKAWDAGNKAQGEFLGTMTNAAKTFYDMGTSGMTQALSAKTSAGDMRGASHSGAGRTSTGRRFSPCDGGDALRERCKHIRFCRRDRERLPQPCGIVLQDAFRCVDRRGEILSRRGGDGSQREQRR